MRIQQIITRSSLVISWLWLFCFLYGLGCAPIAYGAIIAEHPVDQRVMSGDTARFFITLGNAGTTAEYQWFRDGEEIPGAIASTLELPNVITTDSGSWFFCRVTTEQEVKFSVEAGLQVFAKGDFDWDGDVDQDDYVYLTHMKSQALSECPECDLNGDNRISKDDSKLLRALCSLTNCLRPPAQPVISRHPQDVIGIEGKKVSFNVELKVIGVGKGKPDDKENDKDKDKDKDKEEDGGEDDDNDDTKPSYVTYQWLRNGNEIEGAVRSKYSVKKPDMSMDGDFFACRIMVDAHTLISRSARLSLFRQSDVDQDRDVDVDDAAQIEAFFKKSLKHCQLCDVNNDKRIDNKDLAKVIEDYDCPGGVCSHSEPPLITGQPLELHVIEGEDARFSIGAPGSDLNFQWLRDDTDLIGEISKSLLLQGVTLVDDQALFQCRVTGSNSGETLSEQAALRVYRYTDFDQDGYVDHDDVARIRYFSGRSEQPCPECNLDGDKKITINDVRMLIDTCTMPDCSEPVLPEIIDHPQGITVLEGEDALFTVKARGRRLRYQWQVNGVDIPDADQAWYRLSPAELLDHWKRYRCIVTNDAGSVISEEAVLEVEMDVPENLEIVTGLTPTWQQDVGVLTWQPIQDMHYLVHRGSKSDQLVVAGAADDPSFLDTTAEYYFSWYYSVIAVKDYFHPVSGKRYESIGQPCPSALLAAQPAPGINVETEDMHEDGTYGAYYFGEYYSFSAGYTTMEGPVTVIANCNGQEITGSGGNGQININLSGPGDCEVTIKETSGYRSLTFTLHLLADEIAPTLTVNGSKQVKTTSSLFTLSGQAVDNQSGLQDVRISSDQFQGHTLDIPVNSDGTFSSEIPLKIGENNLKVEARDKSGNTARETLTITNELPLLPVLHIVEPVNGSIVADPEIPVSGTVRSSLPAEQIRLLFNNQVYFPQGSQGNYTFSFDNVPLNSGVNILKITAETLYGAVSTETMVDFRQEEQEELTPPSIEITSPQHNSFVSGEVLVSGWASSPVAIDTVQVNDQPAAVTGSGSRVSFQSPVLIGDGASQEISVTAIDIRGVAKKIFVMVHTDDGPPTISIDTPGLQPLPVVNPVQETPFLISGTVQEANLSGFTVNGQPAGLEPEGDGYRFGLTLPLVADKEREIILVASDMAGNHTEYGLALLLSAELEIEVISPREGSEVSLAAGEELPVTIRIPGLASTDNTEITTNGETLTQLSLSGQVFNGSVLLDPGEHLLEIVVLNDSGGLRGQRTCRFTIIDPQLVEVKLERQEPANSSEGMEPNSPVVFYFNKEINPDELQVEVHETVHGMEYAEQGTGTEITGQSKVEYVEIHRDREKVAGKLGFLPGNRGAAFYQERDYGYGATLYITVNYEGQQLADSVVKVRPMPTIIQGFVVDQFMQPLKGITVTLPELGLTAHSDDNGTYSFGMGRPARENIPAGRYALVINKNMTSSGFGTTQQHVAVHEGRLNQLGISRVPILNPQVPFRGIVSGQADALLAGGELRLDLSGAQLVFPDGAEQGSVHCQFMNLSQISYSSRPSAIPQWAFSLQPGGIQVSGDLGVTLSMPPLFDSYDYVQRIGERVVLVGLDPNSLQLTPVGVGKVDITSATVHSEGKLHYQRLDYIGYALVASEQQETLQRYALDEINLNELIMLLEQ